LQQKEAVVEVKYHACVSPEHVFISYVQLFTAVYWYVVLNQ